VIGWYVHHHGHGHLTRFLAVRPHLREPVTVFSSLAAPAALPPETTWVVLPPDADVTVAPDGATHDPRDADPTANGALHWAPIGHAGHRTRLAAIASWIADAHPAAFVVDVSAEVSAFVRLLGVRTVVVTQPGERTDAAHTLAYDLADRILAPWAPETHRTPSLDARGERVVRVGGISRHDGRGAPWARDPRRVLFLGRMLPPDHLARTAELLRTAGWQVELAGTADDRVDDVWPLLCRSAVVVTAAGQNSIADAAAAGIPAVVIPQERPFDEQHHTARVVAALGCATVPAGDPSPHELVSLIEQAAAEPADRSVWQVSGAAARAAAVIHEVAARADSPTDFVPSDTATDTDTDTDRDEVAA
jgi:hypothetical protein